MTLLLLLSLLIRFVTPVDCVLCATSRLEISVRVQLDLSERHFRSDSRVRVRFAFAVFEFRFSEHMHAAPASMM